MLFLLAAVFGAATQAQAQTAPTCSSNSVWCATLTVGSSTTSTAFGWSPYGFTNDGIVYGTGHGGTVTFAAGTGGGGGLDFIENDNASGGRLQINFLNGDLEWLDTAANRNTMTFKVGNQFFDFEDGTWVTSGQPNNDSMTWTNSMLTWAAGDQVTVSIETKSTADDATLSGLSLSEGSNTIPLSPAFSSSTGSYTASVDYRVASSTLMVMPSNSAATVTISKTDEKSKVDGHQLSLDVGSNAITVTVAHGSTTGAYTVTVTRGAGSDPSAPTCVTDALWCATLAAGSSSTEPTLFGWASSFGIINSAISYALDSEQTVTFAPSNTGTLWLISNDNAGAGTLKMDFYNNNPFWLDTDANRNSLSLQIGDDTFDFKDATWDSALNILTWTNSNLTWSTGDEVTMNIVEKSTDDVTLSGLSLSEGANAIPLSPAFSSSTDDYTASVDFRVKRVTVTATKNHADATVTISPVDNFTNADGHQVSFLVGSRTIRVQVAHGSTTEVYTVTVTREGGSFPSAPTCVTDALWCATLVAGSSSTEPALFGWYDYKGLVNDFIAYPAGQSRVVTFTPGNDGVLAEIVNDGGTLNLDFYNLQATWLNTEANRDSLSLRVGGTTFDFEDATWDSALSTLTWTNSGLTWSAGDEVTVNIVEKATDDDATLSGLSLSEGVNARDLSPTFSSTTDSYTASVPYRVYRATLTATKNHADATVTISPADVSGGSVGAPGHQFDLTVGSNAITVTVAHGSTTGAYTVTVTRAMGNDPPAPTCVTDAIWCGTLVAGSSSTMPTLFGASGEEEHFDNSDITYGAGFSSSTMIFEVGVGNSGSFARLDNDNAGNGTLKLDFADGNWLNTPANRNSLNLQVGGTTFDFADATWQSLSKTLTWTNSGFSWSAGDLVTIHIVKKSTDDATLSALSLVEGVNAISLSSAFDSDTDDYTASVDFRVERVLVTATKNHSDATVTISPADVGSNAAGHQLDLSEGSNAITVTVAHGSTTGAYTVTVTRASGSFPAPPTCVTDAIWCATLVAGSSSTIPSLFGWRFAHDLVNDAIIYGAGYSRIVTFEGANTGGLRLIENNNAGTGTLKMDFWDGGATWLNTDANRHSLNLQVGGTTFDFEDATWSPAQKTLTWSNSNLSWSAGTVVTVNIVEKAAIDDATLSGLSLAEGSDPVSLSPAFSSGTGSYTASVPFRVKVIEVTATKNHADATVTISPGDDYGAPDGHQLNLALGSNAITVTVAHGSTTGAYTVTVTRQSGSDPSAPTCVADAFWCATLVAGSSSTMPTLFGWHHYTGLVNDAITYGTGHSSRVMTFEAGSTGSVEELENDNAGNGTLKLKFELGTWLNTAVNRNSLSLRVGGTTFNFEDATWNSTHRILTWANSGLDWSAGDLVTFHIVEKATGDDATLSGLSLAEGRNPVSLSPAFSSSTGSYTASVPFRVRQATLTAMPSNSAATVAVSGTDADNFDDSGYQRRLTVGSNAITVTVTHGSTTGAYTVTVTRQSGNDPSPPTCVSDALWCATLLAGSSSTRPTLFGWHDAKGLINSGLFYPAGQNNVVAFDGPSNTGQLYRLFNDDTGNGTLNLDFYNVTAGWLDTDANRDSLNLQVGGTTFDFANAAWDSTNRILTWTNSNLNWSAGTVVTINIVEKGDSNTPAAGDVTITGLPQVGQTLTADTSGITDADGLTSPGYAYQWIRAGTPDVNLSGQTGSTYAVTAADVGKRLKVRVDFMDDENNPETKTSEATVQVTDNDRPSEAVLLSVTPDTVAEGAGASTLTVTGMLDASARVDAMEVELTIPAGDGYTAVGGTLTIAAGAVSGTARLTLTPEDDNADLENFPVTVEAATTAQATLAGGAMQPMRLEPGTLTVTIEDDDERGVTVTPTALTVAEGGSGEYTVVLHSEPDGGAVAVTLSLSDAAGTNATALPSSLTFQASDWGTAQTVTVTVPEDLGAVEADATATVTHAVLGADYGSNNVPAAAVTVTVPGYELTEAGDGVLLLVSGGAAMIPSGTPALAALAGLSLAFPAAHDGQTVTVMTVPAPGDEPSGFSLGDTVVDISGVELGSGETATVCLPVSAGGELSVRRWDEANQVWVELDEPPGGSPSGRVCGVTGQFSVFAVMVRLEEPELVFSADALTVTIGEEEGATYTVALGLRPAGAVTVTVSGHEGTELSVAPATLVFTEDDWNVAQAVTATVSDEAEAGSEAELTHTASGGRYLGDWEKTLAVTVERDSGLLQRAREAWLARFGRTAAGHVAEAVAERLAALAGQETQLALGGVQPRQALVAGVLQTLAGESRPDGRRMLADSAFVLALGSDGEQSWTAWGRGAYTEFDGEEDGLELDGEVASGTLGVDVERGDWRLGLALSHSEGEGEIREAEGDRYELESSLTGAYPYARWQLDETLSVWGVLGWGEGELEQERDGERTETDLEMRMAAFGLEGALGMIESEHGNFELSLKSDLLAVRVEADADEDEDLPEVEADAQRVRVLLEGAGHCPLESGGVLAPTLEAGLRYDEGDAETGLGAELGAGLRYADGSGRLSAVLNARGLLAHEESGYEEWGVSGSLRLEPDGSGRGLSLTLESALGATGSGTDELWARRDLSGLARDDDFEAAGRLRAEMGLGLNAPGGLGTITPYVGYERMDNKSVWHLGGRLKAGPDLAIGLEGSMHRGGGDSDRQELKLNLSGRW